LRFRLPFFPLDLSSRSFGRVIYTEGKSLIFYALDLDRKKRGRKVSFQAWGERDGEHREPKRLGVVYIDDAVQKRLGPEGQRSCETEGD